MDGFTNHTHTRCNLNINFQVFSSGPQSVSLVLPVRLAAQAAILFFCDEARTQRTKRNNKKINKRKTSGSSSSSSSSSTLYLFS